MYKQKKVYSITINGFKNVEFSVFGVFDMSTFLWSNFFVCSHIGDKTTNDLCSIDNSNITPFTAKFKFKTKIEAIQFLDDFKLKWESETNDTLAYKREKKLDDFAK